MCCRNILLHVIVHKKPFSISKITFGKEEKESILKCWMQPKLLHKGLCFKIVLEHWLRHRHCIWHRNEGSFENRFLYFAASLLKENWNLSASSKLSISAEVWTFTERLQKMNENVKIYFTFLVLTPTQMRVSILNSESLILNLSLRTLACQLNYQHCRMLQAK